MPPRAEKAIAQLFRADQRAHANVPAAGTKEYASLRDRDRTRRAKALSLLAMLPEPSAQTLYHVAWLLNHGDTVEDAQHAHVLASRAAAHGYRPAKWLAAASGDRALMYSGRAQKYGTQIVPDGVRHRVWDTDPNTTDAERALFDVPPLADQIERAAKLTREVPQPPTDLAPPWLKMAIKRWQENGVTS